MDYDVIIIGAGPIGLCLAKALADESLSVAVVERLSQAELADPAFDGREIALTHASMRLLRELDVWQRLPQEAMSSLRAAQIMNGSSPYSLQVDSAMTGKTRLGCLVPNHLIRRAAWRTAHRTPGITFHTGVVVGKAHADETQAWVQLENGVRLQAKLLVAADSRFSETRRALGIDADMHDFGKSMLVCRMQHAVKHSQTAWEWFGHDQSLALLPLDEYRASVALTVTGEQAQALGQMPEADFNDEIARRFEHRLGAMQLDSSRHVYPLVGVYARRFVGPRFALAGDAAVGMHPVTAHGFNLGLAGVERLVEAINHGIRQGLDIGDKAMLARYQRRHRRGTLPLYTVTRAIVELYTDNRPAAHRLREAGLRAAGKLRIFQHALAATLADEGPRDASLGQRLRALSPFTLGR